jgi:CBS domain-containing protein
MARALLSLVFVANPIDRIGEFSEQGRGVPVAASRPAPALPFSPLVRQAYAPQPRARLGWSSGVILVEDVPLEPARPVSFQDDIQTVARLMQEDDSDIVPVVDSGRFVGIICVEEVLSVVSAPRAPAQLEALVSSQIPTCTPRSALVDAVRQMVACYLLRIPVVGDDGALLGMLSMAAAAAASERDPSVRDLLESCTAPSFFAHRWR